MNDLPTLVTVMDEAEPQAFLSLLADALDACAVSDNPPTRMALNVYGDGHLGLILETATHHYEGYLMPDGSRAGSLFSP